MKKSNYNLTLSILLQTPTIPDGMRRRRGRSRRRTRRKWKKKTWQEWLNGRSTSRRRPSEWGTLTPGCCSLHLCWFTAGNHRRCSGDVPGKSQPSQLKWKNEDPRRGRIEWNMACIISPCTPDRAVCHSRQGPAECGLSGPAHFVCLSKWLSRY